MDFHDAIILMILMMPSSSEHHPHDAALPAFRVKPSESTCSRSQAALTQSLSPVQSQPDPAPTELVVEPAVS
eukprot:CAMPEP_0177696750 /NCGR_PEP_ID=MMETSP0484_2-20121128/4145_1 /TAXON_ID=354590 /ORGANISM="Rhodomonas lens, Strain RHODO" /LENGTH=71 /DNA_ID=CAMNT_0019207739 /DNA_START=219 /DNA_END=435 /DNA_ORIENTATION=+